MPDWKDLDSDSVDRFYELLKEVFDKFPVLGKSNESQTETDLVWPILECLGWTASLRQQNLAVKGRQDVPDGLLFADDAAKERANGFAEEWKHYQFGLGYTSCEFRAFLSNPVYHNHLILFDRHWNTHGP